MVELAFVLIMVNACLLFPSPAPFVLIRWRSCAASPVSTVTRTILEVQSVVVSMSCRRERERESVCVRVCVRVCVWQLRNVGELCSVSILALDVLLIDQLLNQERKHRRVCVCMYVKRRQGMSQVTVPRCTF